MPFHQKNVNKPLDQSHCFKLVYYNDNGIKGNVVIVSGTKEVDKGFEVNFIFGTFFIVYWRYLDIF